MISYVHPLLPIHSLYSDVAVYFIIIFVILLDLCLVDLSPLDSIMLLVSELGIAHQICCEQTIFTII